MVANGYGKILDIDLSTRKIVKREIDERFARDFIGGMGFGCKVLYDEVGPNVDPLGPDNVIIISNGLLTGTSAPCAGRTEITNKSPLTGSVGVANTGGVWGATLKHAGIDMLIIRNQADRPVYLRIDDDVAEIRDAAHLWGKDTKLTSDILRFELGPKVSVMAIGPAGEKLVKFACPLNDYHHVAARSGAGAVMGVKKLKAIAVRGTGTVKIARPAEFRDAVRETREHLLTADRVTSILTKAFTDPKKEYRERGCLPAKNFQTGVLEGWEETRSTDLARQYVTGKEGTCHACPISCFILVEVKEGKHAGTRVSRGIHPGVVFHWGGKCAVDNLPAIWKCKEICQVLGLDYVSTSGVIAFAMELFQREIITAGDTDGLELTWGNEDAIMELIRKIAFREGLGNILAEGSVRAAQAIGRGAGKYVMTIKGMEMMSQDPRAGRRGFVFGDLTNPRGGDNLRNTHGFGDRHNPAWPFEKFDMFEEVKKKIYTGPPEECASTWEGKPLMCKWFEDLYSVINSLGLCFFPSGMNMALGPTHFAKLLSACTGWDTSPQEIMKTGERIFTLFKAYTVRQGFTRKDDSWPDRFFTEPMPEGPSKGAILSRETIDKLLDEYYDLRGWDRATGVPTYEKLMELGLGDVAEDLRKQPVAAPFAGARLRNGRPMPDRP
ncbi:MAG: aldehyde ferredoxin oxidoreductase family protein [Chloroflexi bacterium]|nr:aldehyde ferredoxin oxidoreductase family protein [Chloroflexota bacterium]